MAVHFFLGFGADFVGGGDEDPAGELLGAGGRDERVDVGFVESCRAGVALGLYGGVGVFARIFSYEIDSVVGFAFVSGPVVPEPDVVELVSPCWRVKEELVHQAFEPVTLFGGVFGRPDNPVDDVFDGFNVLSHVCLLPPVATRDDITGLGVCYGVSNPVHVR